jgi:hypothetical protein
VNPAVVAFAATATLAGTETAELLLARFTLNPPAGAAEVKVTVQASDPAPAMVAAVHDNALMPDAAIPAALIFTTRLPCDELLLIVTTPVNELTCGEVN